MRRTWASVRLDAVIYRCFASIKSFQTTINVFLLPAALFEFFIYAAAVAVTMRGLYLSTLFLAPLAYGQSFNPNDADSPGQFGQVGTNANDTSYSNPIMTINAGDPCVQALMARNR